MQLDKTTLSYWFPVIEAAGIPVPRTKIIQLSNDAQRSMFNWFDGKDGTGEEASFFDQVGAEAAEIGFPIFLRTGHTSGKHEWDRTCFVPSAIDLKQHIFNLAEHSELAGFIGLPWSEWVVREYLPIIPHGTCQHYGNMPVCREFRFFVDDGKVRCAHPYWPRHALDDGGWSGTDRDFELLCARPHELTDLAEGAGRAVGGSWSIDILETERGWFVTDMAEAHKSFHWEDCPMTDTPSPEPNCAPADT